MKKKSPVAVKIIIIFILFCNIYAQSERNLISEKITEQELGDMLISSVDWHPFPTISDREEWSKVPENIRTSYIKNGEQYLGKSWDPLPATLFLEFVRIDNRSNYETVFYERRSRLVSLVLAEVFENKGRFLDDIMNGIWFVCEETFWGVPAHLSHQKKGFGLPDVTEPVIDLFAAETGAMLAYVYYLVGDKLCEISPMITERIIEEENRRIITPYIEKDFSWKGTGVKKTVNNWNPWINSNVLAVFLFLEKDKQKRSNAIHQIMQSIDVFINGYPDDGGCDEGPSYWSHGPGSVFKCLELLYSATGGKINLYNEPLIQKMGQYIYKVWIKDEYYVNFADASGILNPEAGLIYRYGKRINDSLMVGFGALLGQQQEISETIQIPRHGSLNNTLPNLFVINEIINTEPVEPFLTDSWLPGRQVMAARSFPNSSKGLFLAAKAGNNAENHNHNDVGNFIVYSDGKPVIIDVGVVTYTAKTFGKDRYSVWTMQSQYHNLPTINGVMQKYGREYKAENVKFFSDENNVNFSSDISGAYPPEAEVTSWKRNLNFIKKSKIILTEEYELKKWKEAVELNFMSSLSGDVPVPGKIILSERTDNPSNQYQIIYDSNKYDAMIENIELDDVKLSSVWGNNIIRIVFTAKDKELKGSHRIEISKIQN